ncbi:hypothetical protein TNCV_3246811 [Trichonephila clavipes]|nr:hypothetical protein TNCV_3246811 [Trichonephila clavipes]
MDEVEEKIKAATLERGRYQHESIVMRVEKTQKPQILKTITIHILTSLGPDQQILEGRSKLYCWNCCNLIRHVLLQFLDNVACFDVPYRLEEVDKVQELLDSQSQDLTIDELIEMHEKKQDIEEKSNAVENLTEDPSLYIYIPAGIPVLRTGELKN